MSPVQKAEVANPNQFASNQFWNIGASNKSTKPNKATDHFASFQFWSQPSSSPEHSKVSSFDKFSEKGFVKQEESHKKTAVSFDQLLATCDKEKETEREKGPSPYQKKSQPAEVSAEKERARSVNAEKAEFQS